MGRSISVHVLDGQFPLTIKGSGSVYLWKILERKYTGYT